MPGADTGAETGVMLGGKVGVSADKANPNLRAARLRRGWTADDVAVRLHQLAGELGETPPPVDANTISKWERGARAPSRFYRPRLCLVFEATPEEIGFPPTPRLVQDIGELGRQRTERRSVGASGDGGGPPPPEVDSERLTAALKHLWPVDGPLLAGLDAAARRLGERRDTEPPSAVTPGLQKLLDVLIELLSRPQRSESRRDLSRIAAFTGQNLAMANWVAGDAAATHRTYAIAESLARESRSGAQLALILVDRSEMAGQLARATGEWKEARQLADAAETAGLMDPSTPAGVLAWTYGERATQRAMLGDEHGSGHDLDRMEQVRMEADPTTLNVFSPGIDHNSGWIDVYQVRRALRLGQADEVIERCERILSTTDPRLVWQVAEALVLLAEGLTIKRELGAAAQRLEQGAKLTSATENERDRRAIRKVLHTMRRTWGAAPEVRRLDELLRQRA